MTAMKFNNGLTTQAEDQIDEILMDIVRLTLQIEDLGKHRSYSLAVTKLEEAGHWLKSRKHKAA